MKATNVCGGPEPEGLHRLNLWSSMVFCWLLVDLLADSEKLNESLAAGTLSQHDITDKSLD